MNLTYICLPIKYQAVYYRVISDICFCRSFLDELKACVTSDDIEGIVCLTAVTHIILVIDKGWLNFSDIIWVVAEWLSRTVMGWNV